jgi:hypothetical protein
MPYQRPVLCLEDARKAMTAKLSVDPYKEVFFNILQHPAKSPRSPKSIQVANHPKIPRLGFRLRQELC